MESLQVGPCLHRCILGLCGPRGAGQVGPAVHRAVAQGRLHRAKNLSRRGELRLQELILGNVLR